MEQWECGRAGSSVSRDRAMLRARRPVACLATPLSLSFTAVDRRLCVPALRRVCRLLTEGECCPDAFAPQRQKPEMCRGSRFELLRRRGQPMTFETTLLLELSVPVCLYALIAKYQVPRARFCTTALVVAGSRTSTCSPRLLADVP